MVTESLIYRRVTCDASSLLLLILIIILSLCFEELPELSDADSTCQREGMGRKTSSRHKMLLSLV